MISVSDEERKCAHELKKFCFKNGREKNIKDTGKVLHQLGNIYKRKGVESSDTGVGKINLIQASALYNAAIFRKPDNLSEVKDDLRVLCSDILACADAKNTESDLLTATAAISYEVEILRQTARSRLGGIKSIPEDIEDNAFFELMREKTSQIKQLQIDVTAKFANIMRDLCEFCVKALGTAPCKFALVALGSLVRKEVTPYSDMESVIVLQEGVQLSEHYDQVLEYFRWLAVIFQVVLINLGETIVPCVDVPSINGGEHSVFKFYDAVTPRGISSDGMVPYACKNPLGRQFETDLKPFAVELIKPVREMACLLNTEQDLKNGYHLADMIAESCYVAGDSTVFEEFQAQVKEEVPKLKKKFQESFDSFKEFDILDNLLNISLKSTLNLKRGIYRSSTLFISALGRMHGLCGRSCFEVIEKLHGKSCLTFRDKEYLLFAIAVACESRLRVYLKKNAQDEVMVHSDSVAEIVEAVGIKSVIYYFMITKALQECMSDNGYMDKAIMNRIIITKEFYVMVGYQLRQYESVLKTGRENLESPIPELSYLNYSFVAESLLKQNRNEECLLVVNEWLECTDRMDSEAEKCSNLNHASEILAKIGQHEIALSCLRKSLDIKTRVSRNPHEDKNVANAYNEMGSFWARLQDFEAALMHFKKALEIAKKVTPTKARLDLLQETYNNTGLCEFSLKDFPAALASYQNRLEVFELQNCSLERKNEACETIGMAFRNAGQPEIALEYFFKCLTNRKVMSSDQTIDGNVAHAYENVAVTQSNLEDHARALKYYLKALAIFRVLSTDEKNDVTLAGLYDNIGICLAKLGRTHEAMEYYNDALAILNVAEKLFENEKKIADVVFNIGNCKVDLDELDAAIDYYGRSLEIKQRLTENSKIDKKLADTYSNIGVCYFRLDNYEQSTIYFQQALPILANLSPDPYCDPEIEKLCKFINSLESKLFWKYVEPIVVYKPVVA